MNEIVRRFPIRLSALAIAAMVPTACSSPPATQAQAAAPLEGARIGGPFTLTNQNGKRVTERDFAGKYRIMYFGYTFCPDVCPVDAQNLGAALHVLESRDPSRAARIVPVFVSVDPARDTPAVLKQFVGNFHPRMVGLTGSPAEIAAVAKAYAVYYKKGEVAPGGGYMMDHSRMAYLIGPQGNPIALLSHDGTPQVIAAELERWVR